MADKRIRIIGYGNPSRLDDGLGPAMIKELEKEKLVGIDLETDFQLNIEDLVGLENYSAVIFVDADVSCAPPYDFYPVEPEADISFSSHTVSPASLLGLAESHFGIRIPGYVMAIRGFEFDDFAERLSDAAQDNLQQAKAFLLEFLSHRGHTVNGTFNSEGTQSAVSSNVCEEQV